MLADDTGMFAWWRAADGRARLASVAALPGTGDSGGFGAVIATLDPTSLRAAAAHVALVA